MKKLGGSVFIHNAIEFDYCLKESLASLCAVCDEVVVLDAESTDGTTELCVQLGKELPGLKVVTGAKWECADNFNRLPMLANQAKSHLDTEWHFMLQADEVIHESSFPYIREAVENPKYKSYYARRWNFFGDYNHYIATDGPAENKPCGDIVCRLATIENDAHGDAESIGVDPKFLSPKYLKDDQIVIYHYGYIRKDDSHIKKVIDMQGWFWGKGGQPDSRVLEMASRGEVYDWTMMKTRDMLTRLKRTHPVFALDYVSKRQAKKTIPV